VSLSSDLRVLRVATATARADLAAMYTWRTWLAGWLLRVLAQVTFFALIGTLLQSPETARYLAIGNAVGIVVLEAMLVVASTAWERSAGTLPLLVAAPGRLPLVFVGRSVQWLADGTACACIAFFVVGALFDVPVAKWRMVGVVPLVALIGASTYAFGLVAAGWALKAVGLRNVVSNMGYLALMIVTGVQVPLTYWPGWLQGVAQVLPVTHGLSAVRALVAGSAWSVALRQAALEVTVGAGWLVLALATFRHLAESGRRDGSIEFS
jgi:ABC-2 type transport system permease protein